MVEPSALAEGAGLQSSVKEFDLNLGFKSLRETTVPSTVPQGRLNLAQDASPGLGRERCQSRRDG